MIAGMSDIKIAVPFYTGSGHTKRLAKCIAQGMRGVDACLIDISRMGPRDWEALDAAHAIVFGTPTYMGSTAAAYDAFLEEAAGSRWEPQIWTDKLGAGFTVASHPSGDKLVALQRLATYAAQMGMIWVGQTTIGAPVRPEAPGLNQDGSWLGLMATSSRDKGLLIDAHDRETAGQFGARIARAAIRWGR